MKSRCLALSLIALPLLVSVGVCAEGTAPPAAKPADVAIAPEMPTSVVELEAIKVIPFERRTEFIAGMTQLTLLVDAQIADLSTKAAARKEEAPADWDAAMRSLRATQTALGSAMKELPSASAEFWTASRDKATRTLSDVMTAIGKVKRMTPP